MPKLIYEKWEPGEDALDVIARVNKILDEYAAQDFDLTLRQLYYQFVALDWFPDDRRWRQIPDTKRWVRDLNGTKNADPNYKWLGDIVNRGRLRGLIDWDRIVDRTRALAGLNHFNDPEHMLRRSLDWFHIDRWEAQDFYLEVWIEKEALAGVIEPVCNELDVNFFSCRGYTSQSEMWGAGQRLLRQIEEGKEVRILHLGDHDPSGMDMSRDIEERLLKFLAIDHWRFKMRGASADSTEPSLDYIKDRFKLNRLALNWHQIEEYGPPPNPAKLTDARAANYVREFGYESWELDALEPPVLARLIRDAVEEHRDEDLWVEACEREQEFLEQLREAQERWPEVVEFLRKES